MDVQVRRLTSRLQVCLGLVLSVCVTAYGQVRQPTDNQNPIRSGSGGHTIRGKIFMPSGGLPDQRIRVSLDLTSGGVANEVFSDSVGNFEFRSVASNTYRVTVHGDGHTYETTQETVEVSGSFARTFNVQVYLREKNSEAQPRNKMLSAAEFVQDVPKPAKKLYEQGLKRAKDGKTEEAVASFQEALKLFPDYVLALNKLGEQQVKAGHGAEAQMAFERAVAVGPKYPLSRINLGMLLVQMKLYGEAVEHLEAANHADEGFPMAHLYLGLALMEKTPADLDRAERELQKALALGGANLAGVHLQLFNLYMRRQDYTKGAGALEAYLKDAPNAANASAVRERLAAVKKLAANGPQPAKP
jgi:Tfp pilus assembly protein PilF